MDLKQSDVTRFWSKVAKGGVDDCWLWTGSTHTANRQYTPMVYGSFSLHRDGKAQNIHAHRLAWMIVNDQEPPTGWVICHHCDEPLCCNPAHLFAGTRADNQRDMQRKMRSGIIGEKNPKAKLTPEQVLEIRASDEGDIALGRKYDVYPATIYMARVGRKWRNLPGARPEFYRRRKTLTPEQKADIFRRRAEGQQYKQIAAEVGVSVTYACTLVNSARG